MFFTLLNANSQLCFRLFTRDATVLKHSQLFLNGSTYTAAVNLQGNYYYETKWLEQSKSFPQDNSSQKAQGWKGG